VEDEERQPNSSKQRKKWQDCRKKRMINESRRDSIRRGLQENFEAGLERLEDEMERRVEEGKRVLVELDEKRKVWEGSLVGDMSAKGNRLSMPRLMRLLIRRLSFRRLHLGVERRRWGRAEGCIEYLYSSSSCCERTHGHTC